MGEKLAVHVGQPPSSQGTAKERLQPRRGERIDVLHDRRQIAAIFGDMAGAFIKHRAKHWLRYLLTVNRVPTRAFRRCRGDGSLLQCMLADLQTEMNRLLDACLLSEGNIKCIP